MGEKDKKDRPKKEDKPKRSKKSKEEDGEKKKSKKSKKSKSSEEENGSRKVVDPSKSKSKDKAKKKDKTDGARKSEKKKSDKQPADKKAKKEKKEKKPKGEKKKREKAKDSSDKKKESKSKKKERTTESICCVCKDKDVDALTGGLCDHIFCIPCVENLLHKPMKEPNENDNHLGAPTLGRCLECKTELRKFEMKDTKSGKRTFKRSKGLGDAGIKGKTYGPEEKDTRLAHFCFQEKTPYINFQPAIEAEKEKFLMNDGFHVPDSKYFDDGYHWDKSTKTFHGTISWQPVTFQGAYQWDVILGFTPDFHDIHIGMIHEHKERRPGKKDKVDDGDLDRFKYPLDGKWKLLWLNADGDEQTGAITVRNNEFQQGPYLFNLNFSDPTTPTFRWPLDPVFATAKSGVNLKKKPLGPKKGNRIVWQTTHPAFSEITWERESIGEVPVQATQHFGVAGHPYTSIKKKMKEKPKDGKKEEKNSSKKRDVPVAKSKVKQDDDSGSGSDAGSDSSSDSDSSSSSGSEGGWSDASGNSTSEIGADSASGSDSDSDSDSS